MDFLYKIRDLDKKFAWSFLGFIVGILGIAWGIYTTYFISNDPRVRYEILTNTSIIDIKENISNVDILYNGNSINKKNETLRIITLKVENIGKKNITKYDYDDVNPLGFVIENGEIVELPAIIDTSSNYLLESTRIEYSSKDKIYFSKTMFDKNEYFVIKILVLSPKDKTPIIRPTGKISGVKNIEVIENIARDRKMGVFETLIYGNLLIHIARFIIYFIILIFLIIVPLVTIPEMIENNKRKRIINRYKKCSKYSTQGCEKFYEYIFKIYQNRGLDSLSELLGILKNQEKLEESIRRLTTKKERLEKYRSKQDDIKHDEVSDFTRMGYYRYMDLDPSMSRHYGDYWIEELIDNKLIEVNNGKASIDKDFVLCLDEFVNYLKVYLNK